MMLTAFQTYQSIDVAPFAPLQKPYAKRVLPISFALINAVPGFVSGASRAFDELSVGIITRNSNSFKNSVIHTISALVDLIIMPYQGVKSVFAPKKTTNDLKATMKEIKTYCDDECLLITPGVQNPKTSSYAFNGFTRRVFSPIRGATSAISYTAKAIAMFSMAILALPLTITNKDDFRGNIELFNAGFKFTGKAIASPFSGIAGIFTSRVHPFLEIEKPKRGYSW